MTAALWLVQATTAPGEISALHSDGYEYLKLILIFAVVLVGVLVTLRVWLPRLTGMRQLSSGPIAVLARYPLEARKNLYIVQAAGSYLLVGTSESGLHFLTALEPAAVETSLAGKTAPTGVDFGKLMQSFKRPGQFQG